MPLQQTPVHKAAMFKNWFATQAISLLQHAPFSPDLVPVDLFVFPRVKEQLSGGTTAAASIKTTLSGVTENNCPPTHLAGLA